MSSRQRIKKSHNRKEEDISNSGIKRENPVEYPARIVRFTDNSLYCGYGTDEEVAEQMKEKCPGKIIANIA